MPRKLFTLGILICAIVALLSGCAVNRATATIDPSADLAAIKSIHVTKYPSDNRDVDILIANKLKTYGYTVTTGAQLPAETDAVVSYVDKWMWDITMYMLELTVVVRDRNEFPLASGNSLHTSLTRKSPEEMVDEVLTNIFAKR